MSQSLTISKLSQPLNPTVPLTSSKSESNRALLINTLGGNLSTLSNLSTARDTKTMKSLLESEDYELDVLDAGTVMRFMTAYLALGAKKRKITGTPRMQKRPIKILAEALNELGAHVTYENEEGYPPLIFTPFETQKSAELTVPGNISSQYISALLMIAPTLPNGLKINLEGEIYSRPYIEMTLNLMKHFGVAGTFEDKTISVGNQKYSANNYTIESDWSGASYWFSMVALADSAEVTLTGLREKSNQGDRAIVEIMDGLGVHTEFIENGIKLTKKDHKDHLTIDFKSCPDLGQTVFACAAAKGVSLEMTGLESLRIKESDRTTAMATELAKIGAELKETKPGTWVLTPSTTIDDVTHVSFDTYDDHRMAMALAPLAAVVDATIHEPEVVVKSYPEYWDHMKTAGFEIK